MSNTTENEGTVEIKTTTKDYFGKTIVTYQRKNLNTKEVLGYHKALTTKRFDKKGNEIVEKIGVPTGQPIGVLVAIRDDTGEIKFGHSLCHEDDQYTFSKQRAVQIAKGRALKTHDALPSSMTKLAKEFVKRCETYFKEENLAIQVKHGRYMHDRTVTIEGVFTQEQFVEKKMAEIRAK